MERGGKQVLYTKHPCSAALWAVALCSARRVQSPLSIASVELATGRHSSARHFYPRENWKMLPSPTLLNGQLKAWEYILTLLKPVAGLPWISAMPILHLLRARRGRALNCSSTEKSLCLCWKKSWKSKQTTSQTHWVAAASLRDAGVCSCMTCLALWFCGCCSELGSIMLLTLSHFSSSGFA